MPPSAPPPAPPPSPPLGRLPLRVLSPAAALLLLAPSLPGCVTPVTVEPPPVASVPAPGEARTLELRFRRLDVQRFEKSLTLADLRALPQGVLDRTWLLDLDTAPLLTNTLARVAGLPSAEAFALPRPARNLWVLLNMTPNSANFAGSRLDGLLAVGEAVGLPPGKILSDLVEGGANAPILPIPVIVQAAVADVVATHPGAQRRAGPITAAHPDGLYPVTPGSIPVSLGDVVNDFANLATRYGPAPVDPANPGAPRHPGFLLGASPLVAAGADFAMTVRVKLDALPYKGIDLSHGLVESVNSTRSQIGTMFDFTDPDWLTLRGLAQDLVLGELTLAIHEDARYLAPGTSRQPLPLGNSEAWSAPPWEFEHVIIDAARRRAAMIEPHCTAYGPSGSNPMPFTAVQVCIDATGWVTITVDPSVVLSMPPPAPAYFWDLLVEVAQLRLHDGGLAEGEASVVVTAKDIPVGVTTDAIVASIRANLQHDPSSLADLAPVLNDNSTGDPDFYYYVPGAAAGTPRGDYLYFVAPSDIRVDAQGAPVRPYAYAHPGFFADPGLLQKLSSTDDVEGDTVHEKVAITPGTTLYIEDDQGRRFSLQEGDKPGRYLVSLTFTAQP